MKPQILPTSIEYGNLLREKVEKGDLSKTDYFKLRTVFDDKIMHPPTIADFIPAVYENGIWRVLEKPKHGMSGYDHIYQRYSTALNNVKFSGWHIVAYDEDEQEFQIEKIDENLWITFSENEIVVEDLTNTDYTETINALTTLNLPLTERGITHFNINI